MLKPGGRVILLEHVRSSNRVLGWIMDRLNPLVVRLIVKLIEAHKRG